MAFETSLEVYTLQVREKQKKDIFLSLDNFIKNEDLISFFREFINEYSKITVSEKQQKSLQFTDQIKITTEQRILSGILKSGDYGVESEITDKEGNSKYTKNIDDLDIKPFYYLLWLPKGSNLGILITQRLGVFGVHGLLTNHIKGFFQTRFPDIMLEFNPFVSKEYAKKFIDEGGIREIILKRMSLPSDIAEKFDTNFNIKNIRQLELHIIAENKTFFGINDRLHRFIDDPNARLFTLQELNDIGFDGEHRELIRVKLGKNTRTIDISHVAQLKPYFDIDLEVEKGSNGHPVFESIDSISRNLILDLNDEINVRK